MKNNDNQQILIDIAKQNGITEEKILEAARVAPTAVNYQHIILNKIMI